MAVVVIKNEQSRQSSSDSNKNSVTNKTNFNFPLPLSLFDFICCSGGNSWSYGSEAKQLVRWARDAFAQEEIKVDSSLDTSEDTTDESEQSEDDQQNEGEREADENQIDRLEISV